MFIRNLVITNQYKYLIILESFIIKVKEESYIGLIQENSIELLV